MKKINLAVILALAGAGLATPSAHAALTYNSGDLFIGFYNTGSSITSDYLIDIGQASLYDKQNGSSFTLSIGNTLADLSSASGFGSTWLSSGKTNWGVIGTDLPADPGATLYVGRKENTYGTVTNPPGSTYLRDTTSNQSVYQGFVESLAGDYETNGSATTNSTVATFQTNNTANDPSSWAANAPNPSFGNYANFNGVLAATGNVGHALDLWQITPDNVTPGTLNPTYEGTFTFADTGVITYTSATPEPSTLTALAGGVGLLGFLRRRRAVAA